MEVEKGGKFAYLYFSLQKVVGVAFTKHLEATRGSAHCSYTARLIPHHSPADQASGAAEWLF